MELGVAGCGIVSVGMGLFMTGDNASDSVVVNVLSWTILSLMVLFICISLMPIFDAIRHIKQKMQRSLSSNARFSAVAGKVAQTKTAKLAKSISVGASSRIRRASTAVAAVQSKTATRVNLTKVGSWLWPI